MSSKNSSQIALLSAVENDNFQQVKKLLNCHGVILDDDWMDYNILIYALQNGNKKIIKLLLKYGCRVKRKSKTNEYNTPLYYAVILNNVDIVKMLLMKRASINDKDRNAETPLYLAMKNKSIDIVDLMLSMYDVNNINPTNNDEIVHFNIACIRNNDKLVKGFIEHNMNVNSFVDLDDEKWDGFTPLHFAVEHESVETVKLLLTSGANLYFKNAENLTPFHQAYYLTKIELWESEEQRKKNEKIMNLILSAHTTKCSNPIDNQGISHFHIACSMNNTTVLRKFLETGVDINSRINVHSNILAGYSPLHVAIKNNHKEIVELLLNHSANINIKDAQGCTPMHLAIVSYVCNEIIKVLLEYNADLCVKDKDGYTPIHRAFHVNNGAAIDLLLSANNGNLKNLKNKSGLSHFHIACTRNNSSIVEKFLQRGINLNVCVSDKSANWAGYTALHFATYFRKVNILELLLKHKANVSAVELQGLTPIHLACQHNYTKFHKTITTVPFKKEVDEEDRNQIFILNEQVRIVELLLEYKSDVNTVDKSYNPLLFGACAINISNIMELISTLLKETIKSNIFVNNMLTAFFASRNKIIQILLEHDIDLNVCNYNSNSILHLIASGSKIITENVELAEIFLKNGVNVNAQNRKGETPLHLAAGTGFEELVNLFLKYNADPNLTEDETSRTPLHLATINYSNNTFNPNSNYLKVIDLLITHGANVNVKDSSGCASLLYAIADPKTVEVLMHILKGNCDVNTKNKGGDSALHLACMYNNVRGLTLLLDHGADISITNDKSLTVLEGLCISQKQNFFLDLHHHLEVFKIIEIYVLKMQLIGFRLSSDNEVYYQRLKRAYSSDFWNIIIINEDWENIVQNRSKNDDTFTVQCKEELEIMKSTKIDKYTTLYDVLFKNSQKMTKHVKNETFKKLIEFDQLKAEFPQYGFLLRLQLKKGVEKYVLLKSARDSFQLLIGFDLPDACFDNIFEYLTNEDLNDLIKAESSSS